MSCVPPRIALAALLLTLAPATRAEDPAASPAKPSSSDAPVALEKLLKLPDSLEYSMERRGGATQGEWRERFSQAKRELETAQGALRAAQAEMQESAEEGDWKIAPPGMPGGDSAESGGNYRLRQEIRRQRSEVERAEKQLTNLEVEANLAGVPEEWRTEEAPLDAEAVSR